MYIVLIQQEVDDPSLIVALASHVDIHNCLGVPGLAGLAQHAAVPQLVQGPNPPASRAALEAWLDAIVMG